MSEEEASESKNITLKRTISSSDDREGWSSIRCKIADVFESNEFDILMGLVIAFNIAVLIAEQNATAACGDKGKDDPCNDVGMSWPGFSNIFLLIIYTLEIVFRLFVYHLQFFSSKLNCLDAFIVAAGYVDFLGETFSLAMLRIVRIARLARAHRLAVFVPELFFIIRGFASAMVTIFWGSLLTMIMLLIWSMLAVELVHPITRDMDPKACERCPAAFGSVYLGVLTLFQTLVSGDSWGQVAVPIIEHAPYAFIIFGGTVFTYIGFANLIVAVVVDAAVESRDCDKQAQVLAKESERREVEKHLFELCKEMDADASGSITLEELLEGYDLGGDLYATLHLMDIEREELVGMFHLFDRDHSGSLSYEEFVENIYKLKTRDTRMMLVIMQYQISQMLEKIIPPTDELKVDPAAKQESPVAPLIVQSQKAPDVVEVKEQAMKKELPPTPVSPKDELNIGLSHTQSNSATGDTQKATLPLEGLNQELARLRRSLDDRLSAILEDQQRRSEEQTALAVRYGEALELLLRQARGQPGSVGATTSDAQSLQQLTSLDAYLGRAPKTAPLQQSLPDNAVEEVSV